LAAVLLLVLAAGDLQAQEVDDRPRTFPGHFEAASRSRAVVERADDDRQTIINLADVGDLQADLARMREHLAELRLHIAAVTEAEYMRPERLSRIRDHAIQHQQRLEGLRDAAGARLETLEERRSYWLERQDYWIAWRDTLAAQGTLENVRADVQRALSESAEILSLIDESARPLLDVQEESVELRDETARSAAYIASVRAGRREALTQRSEPVLLTGGHLSELTAERLLEWEPLPVVRTALQPAFFRTNGQLIFLHVLLILVIYVAAVKLQRLSIPEGAWSGLLLRPKSLAIFASTALLTNQYIFAPALWDVLMWALLAGAGSVLATRLVKEAAVRKVVFTVAVFYPAFLLAEALLIPPPYFRLFMAGVALAGGLYFLHLGREGSRAGERGRSGAWAIGLGVLMWSVVFVAEVLGFYFLTRWVLHATITSAYVVFVVLFVMVLARGAMGTLVRTEGSERFGILRTLGVPLMERLLMLLQIALVIIAGLQILDIWEVSASPAETWSYITGIGTPIAGVDVTIGRVMAAIVLVYLAVLFSWILRTFAKSEVYPRWEMERGVGDSINALVHYFLITVGVFIGLGALGVELQNFAIVAGALGVGIGFGLQNIVNNFVSGLILLFERPVRVGDTVVIGTELGAIKKIGLRSTTVQTFDQAEVIVPNADLVSEKVTNWTLTDPVARLILPVGVAYGTDVHKVLELLREAASSSPEVLPTPEPQTLFMEFGDSALEFELRVWVKELRFRLAVRSAILAEVDRLFREHDIEIPFPQRDLHLRSVDTALLGRMMGDGARDERTAPRDGPELPPA
jgi:potassium-dependent mechanosensitive channel